MLFSCIWPNSKIFPCIFFVKNYIASFLYFKMKIGYRNQFTIIRWNLPKISKTINHYFVSFDEQWMNAFAP